MDKEPLITPAINVCKIADLPFNAYLHERGVGLFAITAKAALQRAVEHFQVKAKDRHLVEVRPAGKSRENG